MATILQLGSFADLNTLVNSLVVSVQGGIIAREQAQVILKDRLYESNLLKRPIVFVKPEKAETKKKE